MSDKEMIQKNRRSNRFGKSSSKSCRNTRLTWTFENRTYKETVKDERRSRSAGYLGENPDTQEALGFYA
jgi:hypothetical protein